MSENSQPNTVDTQILEELSGKYLTFVLADTEYAIGILKVREIVGLIPVTCMPETPDYVRGVINLRNEVIPVVDLRVRLGLKCEDDNPQTCIIIVEVSKVDMLKCWEVKKCGKEECPAYGNRDRRCWYLTGTHCGGEIQGSYHQKKSNCGQCPVYQHAIKEGTVVLVGLVVDGVTEVLPITNQQIDPPPAFTTVVDTGCILGMVKNGNSLKILLDIDQVMTGNNGGSPQEVA